MNLLRKGNALEVKHQKYRGYDIRYRQNGQIVEASVTRSKAPRENNTEKPIRLDADDVSTVLAKARELIDSQWAKRKVDRRVVSYSRGDSEVGTVENYIEALKATERSKPQHKMLIAHAEAPDRTLTATDLAEAGWGPGTGFGTANLYYGKLGRSLAEYLELTVLCRANGEPIWTTALAEGLDPVESEESPNFRWRLHEEIAEALRRLNR